MSEFKLYCVVGYNDRDHDGNSALEYLLKRYKPADDFGFFPPSNGKMVFFKDEGHRDEFIVRFGGMKATATPKAGVLERARALSVAQDIISKGAAQ